MSELKRSIVTPVIAILIFLMIVFSINGALAAKDSTIRYLTDSQEFWQEHSESLSCQLLDKENEQSPIQLEDKGEFKLTFYHEHNRTKNGAVTQVGVTVAVDPAVIPLGSYIYIEGLGVFVAQDTGGKVKGNVIDVFVSSKDEAKYRGVDSAKVYVLGW